jgi:hypothetical protein
VHVERLLALDPGKFEYIGRRINEGFAAGGAGYIVSRRAARFIADWMTPKNPVQYAQGHWGNHEDMAVGKIMKRMGVELWDNKKFNHGNDYSPTPHNDSISGHHIQPDYMRQLWSEFQQPLNPIYVGVSPSHPSPCPTPQDSLPESPHQKSDSDLPL